MGQENKAPKKKKIAKIPLHVYIGYLLIITLLFTGMSFAKFATTGDAADTARVASFSVNASVGNENNKSVGFNDAASSFDTTNAVSYDVNVTNSENGKVSEVAVGYKIIVKLGASVIDPSALTLKIDDTVLSPSKVGNYYVYTYVGADPMPAKNKTDRTHILSITAISAKITDDYTNIPFDVTVTFEQIN